MKKFIVVIDTQYDFVIRDGKLPVLNAHTIIAPGVQYLAGLNAEDTAGVLFTFDTHVPEQYEGSEESKLFPVHCVKGTTGWENVFNPLLVSSDIATFTLEKGVFNMWEQDDIKIQDEDGDSSDREFFFEQLKQHADTVVVIGVASDFCVKWAIDGFIKRGWNVEVVQNLTMGIVEQITEVLSTPEYNNVRIV